MWYVGRLAGPYMILIFLYCSPLPRWLLLIFIFGYYIVGLIHWLKKKVGNLDLYG